MDTDHRARAPPIYATTSFGFKNAEHGAKLFADASDKDLEAAVLILGGTAQRLPAADAAACLEKLVAEAHVLRVE